MWSSMSLQTAETPLWLSVMSLQAAETPLYSPTVWYTRWKLDEAYGRRLQAYESIRTALQKYTASGWTVWFLPLLVGVQVHNEQSLQDALKFLGIPHKKWPSTLQDSVRASIEALAFICRQGFSLSLQNGTFDADDPQSRLGNACSRSEA